MTLILCRLLQAYFLVLIGRIVLSWFPITPGTTTASVFGIIYSLTEPVLGPVRRVIPPMGMFDVSSLVVIMVLLVVERAVCFAV